MTLPVAVRALLFTLVAPTAVAVAAPWWLLQRWPTVDIGPLRHAGWPLMLAGAAGYLVCVRAFVVHGRGTPNPLDPPQRFVASGLYRQVRNPMYVSIGLTLVGEALVWQAPALLLYLLALWAVFHGFVVLYEEPHLRRVFGDEYARYLAAVPRWLVRPRPVGAPDVIAPSRTSSSIDSQPSPPESRP